MSHINKYVSFIKKQVMEKEGIPFEEEVPSTELVEQALEEVNTPATARLKMNHYSDKLHTANKLKLTTKPGSAAHDYFAKRAKRYTQATSAAHKIGYPHSSANTARPSVYSEEQLTEANYKGHYHSVFVKTKGQDKWGHDFDADTPDDAKEAAGSIRNSGDKALVIKVPKKDANWNKIDVHDFVTSHLASKQNKVK